MTDTSSQLTRSRTRTAVRSAAAPETASAPETVEGTEAPPLPDLRKREIIEAAVARSGVKKKNAKPVVEAVLALLGEALAEGRGLNMPELGKVRIARRQPQPRGEVIVCKLRRKWPEPDATAEAPDPLAAGEEDR